MFGKLLKYDFRSMLKQFAFIWPAALVLALVNRFTVNSFVTSASGLRQTVSGVAMLVYVGIMIAMFVVTMIFVIQRFFRGLLGDEGYLMHTLPVRPWELIGSKLLCAVVTTLLSIVVAILSILLIMPISWSNIFDMFKGFHYLFSHWNMEFTHIVLFLLEFLLLICLGMANGYLHLYLSMAIGHLFNRNRVAMSVVAYIAINALVGILIGILGNMGLRHLNIPYDLINFGNAPVAAIHLSFWISILIALAGDAVYFFCTEYILRKRLNLE